MNEERKPALIIDTDPGIDDAAAIFWVIANGKWDLKALCVVNGNVGMEKCLVNALRIVEVAKRPDIPVYAGAWRPLVKPPVDASWVHGNDGMGDAELPLPTIKATPGYAPAEMIRIAKESPEPITIAAIGPLTNLAIAISMDREFKNHVKEILFMGGAVLVPGNDSPQASFNVMVDPEAAKVVYNSGIPVVQLGLDICDKYRILDSDMEKLSKANTPVTNFIMKMSKNRMDAIRNATPSKWYIVRTEGVGFNDMPTAAYLVHPEWYKTEMLPVDIELNGLCAGRTVVDFRGQWKREPNVCFAYDVDSRAAIDRWVEDLVKYNP